MHKPILIIIFALALASLTSSPANANTIMTSLSSPAYYSMEPTDRWTHNSFNLLLLYSLPQGFVNERPYCHEQFYDQIQHYFETLKEKKTNPVTTWEAERLYRGLQEFPEMSSASTVSSLFRFTPYSLNSFEDKAEPLFRYGLKGEVIFHFASNLFMQVRGRLENKGHLDSFAKVRRWEDKLTGYFDYALLGFRHRHFDFTIGRTLRAYGPHDNDRLLISTNSPAFDQISMSYSNSWLSFSYWTTRLNSFHDADSNKINRYLAAHRLAIKPHKRLEIGMTETVLYGREGSGWELYYLNPLLPFYWEQYNNRIDDNIYWQMDFSWFAMDGLKLYGELLIDDFQIDFVTEPHQLGFNLGFSELGLLLSDYLQIEADYTQIRNTVYGQNKFWNVFANEGVVIGSSLGTDADRLRYRITWHHSPLLRFAVGGSFDRKGEGRYDNRDAYPAPQDQPFPSGTVQERWDNYFQVHLFNNHQFELLARGGYRHIDNLNNMDSDFHTYYLTLNIFYYLDIPLAIPLSL